MLTPAIPAILCKLTERQIGTGDKSAESLASTAFDVLQASIARLGYKLVESSRDRIGLAIATNFRNFWRKIDGMSNGKKRKTVRGSKWWVTMTCTPNEILLSPRDVVTQHLHLHLIKSVKS